MSSSGRVMSEGPPGPEGPEGPPGPAKAMRTGIVAMTILQTSKVVTFSEPMPSVGYRVVLEAEMATAVGMWPTAKTVNGFTLNLTLGVSGNVSYVAIED